MSNDISILVHTSTLKIFARLVMHDLPETAAACGATVAGVLVRASWGGGGPARAGLEAAAGPAVAPVAIAGATFLLDPTKSLVCVCRKVCRKALEAEMHLGRAWNMLESSGPSRFSRERATKGGRTGLIIHTGENSGNSSKTQCCRLSSNSALCKLQNCCKNGQACQAFEA